jgi:putative acetyltransferase
MADFVHAESPQQLEEARTLFREYAATLGCSPCLQNIEQELGHLPGEYGPPAGRLLLALHEGRTAGCGAFRDIGNTVCEMRRMFVRPEFRV